MTTRPVLLVAVLLIVTGAFAQDVPPPIDVLTAPSSVTVYRGRAAVTRDVTVSLETGMWALRFGELPQTLQPDTLQARLSGGARVLGVEYEERAVTEAASGRIADLDERIADVRRSLAALDRRVTVVVTQETFLDAIGARMTDEAVAQRGTRDLDLEAVGEQLAFVTAEREKLMEQRGRIEDERRELQRRLAALEAERSSVAGTGGVERGAVVTIGVPESGPIDVALSYLVTRASWQPAYNVRADADGSTVVLEFDANLTQQTGEDWESVALTLSTAQPTLAANPPELRPWFVDVRETRRPAAAAAPADAERSFGVVDGVPTLAERSKGMAADAEVGGAGPSVTYVLPRRVTVGTDVRRQQRTRIATIDLEPTFTHVAVPLLTEAVYIRGDLINRSQYQLLPGRGSIFIGADYVGPTPIASVPPGARFEVYFGIDPAVTARRTLVEKKTAKTGLLGGGRRTTYEYRMEIDNGAGKTLALELWDRIPVSRTDQIEVETINLSHALDTSPFYTEDELTRGLLKWPLAVPPTSGAPGSAFTVTYGVRVVRAKDVDMTPLPE
ncbi:MAG: mucoidy inhibitor MuiA family protein [Planctomycetes bacterium]|nr:mucoidy inhibitor MuiA family protein [Planctomycetota bacterium]